MFNPFKPNGISHLYQMEHFISVLKDIWWYFSSLFKFQYNILQANSGDPDQTPRSVASDLGLHCLNMSHKKDARLKQVNYELWYILKFILKT